MKGSVSKMKRGNVSKNERERRTHGVCRQSSGPEEAWQRRAAAVQMAPKHLFSIRLEKRGHKDMHAVRKAAVLNVMLLFRNDLTSDISLLLCFNVSCSTAWFVFLVVVVVVACFVLNNTISSKYRKQHCVCADFDLR